MAAKNMSSIINIVSPELATPFIGHYKDVRDAFRQQADRMESDFLCISIYTADGLHKREEFQQIISDQVAKLGEAWNEKPRAFESIDSANGYISYAEGAVSQGIDFIEKLADGVNAHNLSEETGSRGIWYTAGSYRWSVLVYFAAVYIWAAYIVVSIF